MGIVFLFCSSFNFTAKSYLITVVTRVKFFYWQDGTYTLFFLCCIIADETEDVILIVSIALKHYNMKNTQEM